MTEFEGREPLEPKRPVLRQIPSGPAWVPVRLEMIVFNNFLGSNRKNNLLLPLKPGPKVHKEWPQTGNV
jgi:hypothetical protein